MTAMIIPNGIQICTLHAKVSDDNACMCEGIALVMTNMYLYLDSIRLRRSFLVIWRMTK